MKMFGSRVVPDLLDTMKRVLAGSSLRSTLRIWAGSVESSTCSSGKPAPRPKVIRSTSGQRLEPPIPRSRTWSKPPVRASSWARLRRSSCAISSSGSPSQPSHEVSSVPVHSEASRSHRRRTLPASCQAWISALTAASRSAGSVHVWLCTSCSGSLMSGFPAPRIASVLYLPRRSCPGHLPRHSRGAPERRPRIEGDLDGHRRQEVSEAPLEEKGLDEAAVGQSRTDPGRDAAAHHDSPHGHGLEGEVARLAAIDGDETIERLHAHRIALREGNLGDDGARILAPQPVTQPVGRSVS